MHEHVVLIHGTWGRGDSLADAWRAFEERGFTVHTPTLRYHELPIEEGARLNRTVEPVRFRG
jgi:esterase/lipase